MKTTPRRLSQPRAVARRAAAGRWAWPRGFLVAAAAASAAAALASCASGPALQRPKDPATQQYLEGLQQLRAGNHLDAAQAFVNILKMPAYVTVVPVARLRLGDALFAQGKFEEAIEVYEGYLQRHEGTRDVAWAAWRVASCHARMVPEDFWLLPPVHEMDLGAADKARYHLERFVRAHPTAPYVAEALQLRDAMVALELRQHRYVISFYRERGSHLGVAFRSHEMMRRYPLEGHGLHDYQTLAAAYGALGWRRRARDLHRAITQRWPQHPAAGTSRAQAAAIDADMARRRAGGDPAAEMPADAPPTAAYEPEKAETTVRIEG